MATQDFKASKDFLENQWFESKYSPKKVIKGPLTREKIIELSQMKNEPEWILVYGFYASDYGV